MVLMESGLKSEGLLEPGFDWYVQRIQPTPSALTTNEFNGVLADWKSKVDSHQTASIGPRTDPSKLPADLTVQELIGSLKPAQLWSAFVALAALVWGAFALGAKLIDKL
jgi:hypothetical protein